MTCKVEVQNVPPLIIRFHLPFFRHLNVTSAYEYLEKRFNVGVRLFGSGALVGAVSSAIILYFVQRDTNIHFFLYAAVGFTSCFAIGYICSCLLRTGERDLAGLTIYDIAKKD